MGTFFRYLFVGGLAAGVDFLAFGALLYGLDFNWFWAAFCSFIVATTVNYVLSVRHVFDSGIRFRRRHEISLVFIVSGMGLAVNQTVLYFCIGVLGIHPLVAKIFATGVVFFWNYFARARFIFKK